MKTLNWKPSAWWMLGALASFLCLAVLAFQPWTHHWGIAFLIPEGFCLVMYSRARGKENYR